METTTLSYANMHEHGALFPNMLRARHRTFIEMKNWELPEESGMEFDQYDTAQSRWCCVHENGRVMAGVRLTPTTAGMRRLFLHGARCAARASGHDSGQPLVGQRARGAAYLGCQPSVRRLGCRPVDPPPGCRCRSWAR